MSRWINKIHRDAIKNMKKGTKVAELAGNLSRCFIYSAVDQSCKITMQVPSAGWWWYMKRVFLVCSITTLTASAAGLICTWYDKRLIIWQGDPRGRTISVIATQYLSEQQTVRLLIQDATFSRDSANAVKKHLSLFLTQTDTLQC